jgi:hypothetical protein
VVRCQRAARRGSKKRSPVFYGDLAAHDIGKPRKRGTSLRYPFDATACACTNSLLPASSHARSAADAATSLATARRPHRIAGFVYRTITGAPTPSEIALAFPKYERAPAVKAFPDFARRPETPA